MDAQTVILMIICLLLHVWAWHALQADMARTNKERIDP